MNVKLWRSVHCYLPPTAVLSEGRFYYQLSVCAVERNFRTVVRIKVATVYTVDALRCLRQNKTAVGP